MRVKILADDERLGLKKGEIYTAQRYRLDPHEKITLLAREPDGHDPSCNLYRHEPAFWINSEWMVIRGNRYVPEAHNR